MGKLKRKCRKENSEEWWGKYRTMKNLLVKDIKFTKRETWRKFCQEVSGIKGASDIGKFLKSKQIPGNCTLEKPGGVSPKTRKKPFNCY